MPRSVPKKKHEVIPKSRNRPWDTDPPPLLAAFPGSAEVLVAPGRSCSIPESPPELAGFGDPRAAGGGGGGFLQLRFGGVRLLVNE